MSSSGWNTYWQNQGESFNAAMKIATGFFASQMETVFHINSNNEIFDYGCGPGFLIDGLAPRTKSIVGADINVFFLEQCRKNHPASLFINITTDVETNRRILNEQLEGRKFDYVVLLSISQYFKNMQELEKVVGMLFSCCKENGKIIVADVIDQNTSSLRDAISLFLHCLRKGKVMVFFSFMFYLLFSDYRKLSQKMKLLRVPEKAVSQMADRNGWHYKKIEGLTIHSSRTNYVFARHANNNQPKSLQLKVCSSCQQNSEWY